jgi:hypothetical protein
VRARTSARSRWTVRAARPSRWTASSAASIRSSGPLRLAIGPHTARCTLPDHEPAEGPVTLEAGALASITLAPTPIDRRPVLERVGSPGEAQRIVGITALSLGGVSVAVGLSTLFVGLDTHAPDRESYFDVARGTLIAGGVLVVAGLVLVLTAE